MTQFDRDMKEVGNLLKRYRHNRGISQASVARQIEVSLGYIAQIENANKIPSLGVLHRLCGFYGVPLSDVFAMAEEMADRTMRELMAVPSIKL